MTSENSPFVSVLISTRNRPEPLLRCLRSVLDQDFDDFEVLVFDDASHGYDIVGLLKRTISDPRLHCFRSEYALGIVRGRNFLMRQARGQILIGLDDDALFADEKGIRGAVDYFSQSPDVGVLAFKIIRHKGGNIDLQIPFSQRHCRKWPNLYKDPGLVSHYIGAGHALRREIIERGDLLYQEEFLFGEEELELSYKIIQAGFKILYTPLVVVHHYQEASVLGNVLGKRPVTELQLHTRNRIWLAYKYIPFPYLPVNLLVWVSYWGVRAVKSQQMGAFLRGIGAGIWGLRELPRTPLDKRAVRYLKNNWGRLWY